MKSTKLMAAGIAATILAGAMMSGPAAMAQSKRQNDKNTMRNIGIGAGAAAAWEALHGKGTNALILGAGAAYAGKKYEDARKAQSKENNYHRYGYSKRHPHHR